MEELLEFIEREDLEGFCSRIENAGNLAELKDSIGSNLIHATAIYSAFEILNKIFEHVINKKESKILTYEEIQDWVNEKNSDGNSALLFACMSGSLEVIKILCKHGADINAYNLENKNAIHFAAEKDYAHIISYLSNQGAELTRSSITFQTPIHLSVLMNSYKSTSLLLALKVTRKRQDQNGHTALHLAAKNNNGRMVRLLLFKGFDPSVKDKQGKTAEDLTNDLQIKALFHSEGLLQLFGYRPMVADGKKKNFTPFITLSVLIITVFVVNSVFLETCNVYPDNNFLTYLFAVLAFINIGLIVYINFSNPGYLPLGEEKDLTTLYSDFNDEVCPECCILRPSRSRHCFFCARCVGKYDHHCHWVNNCIGGRNLGVFMMFLLMMESACIVLVSHCITVFVHPINGVEKVNHKSSVVIASILFIIGVLGGIVIGRLIKLHLQNFFLGRTSSERFSRSSMAGSRLMKYSLRNFWKACCNSD